MRVDEIVPAVAAGLRSAAAKTKKTIANSAAGKVAGVGGDRQTRPTGSPAIKPNTGDFGKAGGFTKASNTTDAPASQTPTGTTGQRQQAMGADDAIDDNQLQDLMKQKEIAVGGSKVKFKGPMGKKLKVDINGMPAMIDKDALASQLAAEYGVASNENK